MKVAIYILSLYKTRCYRRHLLFSSDSLCPLTLTLFRMFCPLTKTCLVYSESKIFAEASFVFKFFTIFYYQDKSVSNNLLSLLVMKPHPSTVLNAVRSTAKSWRSSRISSCARKYCCCLRTNQGWSSFDLSGDLGVPGISTTSIYNTLLEYLSVKNCSHWITQNLTKTQKDDSINCCIA